MSVHFTTQLASSDKITFEGGEKLTTSFMVSGGCYFSALNGIHFGYNVLFAPGVKIISSNHNVSPDRLSLPGNPVRLGNNVWIGTNAVILPEVSIGDNCIIGAGAIVTKSFPSNCILAGNPAKIIGLICDCGGRMVPGIEEFKCSTCSSIKTKTFRNPNA